MEAKKAISPLRKILYGIMLLALLPAAFGTSSTPPARAMGGSNPNAAATGNSSQVIMFAGNILSNGQFVYGPNVGDFKVKEYLKNNAPHLAIYGDKLNGRAEYFSINPRVYITLLEIQSSLISNPDASQIENPFGLGGGDFLEQIDAISETMVEAYYLHLYSYSSLPAQEQKLPAIPAADGRLITPAAGTNAGTYAILAGLAKMNTGQTINMILDNSQSRGFTQTFMRLFPGDDPTNEENIIYLPGDVKLATAPVNLLQLPYPRGESWNFNGVHDGAGGSVGSAFADASSIDFSPGWPGWNTDTSNMWVVAAASGTPTKISNCNFKIVHADGWQTVYYHLENIQTFSGSINQNDRIGVIANTLSEAICNGGSSTGPHVHFTLKLNGALVAINGTSLSNWVIHSGRWNYDSNRSYMWLEKSGSKKYVGDPLLSEAPGGGGSCPGPSLGSPGDGYISTSQTVNFTWSGLSGCTFNGYTFRIKDISNMDSGGTNIVDTGEGGTSRSETIGTQWNNRDLYWGVRAANAPSGASWSVRRFRIEPGSSSCSPNADQIALFTDADYGGSCVVKGLGDYANPAAMGIGNDSLSSIKVGSNVKLTLCTDDNYAGGCETFSGDDPNLSDNGIGNDQASSAKVEPRGGSCTNGATYAALQPGYTSCANEGGTCTFSGQASVAFGASNCYFYQTFTSSVGCNNTVFGDPISGTTKTCSYKILNATDGAAFITQSPYPTLSPGQSFQIYFEVQNSGNTTWEPGSYWLQNLQNPLGAAGQQSLTQTITPGDTYRWTINQVAPTSPGVYRSQWMVSHNGTSFGPSMFIDVTVAGTSDDVYEENDSPGTAYDLSSHENTWLSSISGPGLQKDEDWYRIEVTPGYQNVVIDLRFTHADGDIDLKLYDSAGNPVIGSYSTTDNEHIDTIVPASGPYYIAVYYGNQGNSYDLWWDDLLTSSTGSLSAGSTGTNDGWILESRETTNQGGSFSTSGMMRIGDDASNRQYRGILFFDTSSLPDNATITGVTLKIKKYSMIGTSPFTTHGYLIADIITGTFGLPSLQITDFQAASSKQNVGRFSIISGTTNWYQLVMGAINYPYINLAGVTQFRLRFGKDDNNDWGADFITFHGGEALPANAPVLIIEYSLP